MRKLAISIIIIFLALTSSPAYSVNIERWFIAGDKTWFIDRDESYKFVPPKGWNLKRLGDDTVTFYAPQPDQGYRPGIMIMRGVGIGFKDFNEKTERESTIFSLSKERKNFKFVLDKKITINNIPAYLIIYEHVFEKLHMKCVEVYLINKGNYYITGLNALAPTFDKYYPVFLESLYTFVPSDIENYNFQLEQKYNVQNSKENKKADGVITENK